MRLIDPLGYRWLRISIHAACMAALSCCIFTTDAFSQSAPASRSGKGTLRYKPPSQPSPAWDFSSTGAPTSRGSAGSRGSCPVSTQEPALPIALVPFSKGLLNEQIIDVPLGHTVSSHPTFWFKFVEDSDAIERLDLVVVDEETQSLVQEIRDISELESASLPGISGVQWPSTGPALEMNRLYRWFLVIECHGPNGAGLFLSGLILRKELPDTINSQLQEATARERAWLYAENGIWYEAATELHQALQHTPNSVVLKSDWESLLNSIGL